MVTEHPLIVTIVLLLSAVLSTDCHNHHNNHINHDKDNRQEQPTLLPLPVPICEEPMLLAKNNLCVCPMNCRCHTWTKLRRVDCVRRRLVNINANDIPMRVQALDISDNLIVEFTEGYFWGLSQIELLFAARNALHNVDRLAFSGLRRLTVLDLSDNRLRILPPRLFADVPRLRELRLAGNHLISVSPAGLQPLPLVEATRLQELDLSRCQLAYLSSSAFIGVPRIISLNVSNNQFLQLPTAAFSTLTSLKHLYADGNPFNCDSRMEELSTFLKNSSVTVSGLCKGRSSTAQFARMMALPPESYRPNGNDYPSYDDWETEELFTPEPPHPSPPPAQTSEDDRCGEAITKPDRFFKFEYSNVFSLIVGFKIGFVTALLLLRGCHGRAQTIAELERIPAENTSSSDRLIVRQQLPADSVPRENINPHEAGRQCNTEETRPETPPPAYHELRFNATNGENG